MSGFSDDTNLIGIGGIGRSQFSNARLERSDGASIEGASASTSTSTTAAASTPRGIVTTLEPTLIEHVIATFGAKAIKLFGCKATFNVGDIYSKQGVDSIELGHLLRNMGTLHFSFSLGSPNSTSVGAALSDGRWRVKKCNSDRDMLDGFVKLGRELVSGFTLCCYKFRVVVTDVLEKESYLFLRGFLGSGLVKCKIGFLEFLSIFRKL